MFTRTGKVFEQVSWRWVSSTNRVLQLACYLLQLQPPTAQPMKSDDVDVGVALPAGMIVLLGSVWSLAGLLGNARFELRNQLGIA